MRGADEASSVTADAMMAIRGGSSTLLLELVENCHTAGCRNGGSETIEASYLSGEASFEGAETVINTKNRIVNTL